MTIDEAIADIERVAALKDSEADSCRKEDNKMYYDDCRECAKEHRQVAEWLRDYKRLLEEKKRDVPDSIVGELNDVRQELLERGDEMVSFRQLVERFDEVEEEYKGVPWNLKQIYNNFNILIGERK